MDEALIRNWNSVVGPSDVVWHLGDFSMGTKGAEEYLNRLSGQINLIVGNHDKKALRIRDRFASVSNLRRISVDDETIVLCHYAMKVWEYSHHGSWHLYGHSHGNLPDDKTSLSLDVGVDCWNFTPVSMAQLRERMSRKTFVPVDHHGHRTT